MRRMRMERTRLSIAILVTAPGIIIIGKGEGGRMLGRWHERLSMKMKTSKRPSAERDRKGPRGGAWRGRERTGNRGIQ